MHSTGVLNTVLLSRAAPAPSNNTNSSTGDGRSVVGGERAVIENEYLAPEGKFAVSKRYYCEETNGHATPTTDNLDEDEQFAFKGLDLNDDEADIKEYSVERIFGCMQRAGRIYRFFDGTDISLEKKR